MQPQQPIDYDQPVAYDREGRPLYAHPPTTNTVYAQQPVAPVTPPPIPPQSQYQPQTQSVLQPQPQPQTSAQPVVALPDPVATTTPTPLASDPLPENVVRLHQNSVETYPNLNLSQNEFVILEIKKHWIGMVAPILFGGILGLLACGVLALYPVIAPDGNLPFMSLFAPVVLVLVLIGLGTYISIWVYNNNVLFLTNESAIQVIQKSLFARQEQTISLGSIEDVSYNQTGMLQSALDYGTIRLSTVGEEGTYTFYNAGRPKELSASLTNAVESYKNGRPVGF